jgi:hypothetical protein
MPRWLKYTLLGAVLLFLASFPLARQFDTGAMEGYITNESGPLAGASVEARNVMTGEVTRVYSNAAGYYKLDALRPGRYSLWVTAKHHDSTRIPEVFVERGRTLRRDIRLLSARAPSITG